MVLVITYIRLRNTFHFFALSWNAMKIVLQLRKTPCIEQLSRGFGIHHYTMTLWPDMASMKEFSKSGAHLQAMKKSASIARETKFLTLEVKEIPTWKDAILQVKEHGRSITYD